MPYWAYQLLGFKTVQPQELATNILHNYM